jgi:hypothetical protein
MNVKHEYMKNSIELKKLADRYFYENKILTKKERTLLENSKYSHILRENDSDSMFDSLINDTKEENPLESKKEKDFKFQFIHLNKKEITNLIDYIEYAFELDLSDRSVFNYMKVNNQHLRDVIRKYINLNFKSELTLNYVNKLINNKFITVPDILIGLYNVVGR